MGTTVLTAKGTLARGRPLARLFVETQTLSAKFVPDCIARRHLSAPARALVVLEYWNASIERCGPVCRRAKPM